MPERQELIRALDFLDREALAMLLDPKNEEYRDSFCRLISDWKPILTADYQLGEVDVLRRNIVGLSDEILAAAAAARSRPDPKRDTLVISYMRCNDAELTRHLWML